MTKGRAQWAPQHGRITKVLPSDRCGGETDSNLWWDSCRVGADLEVIWKISAEAIFVASRNPQFHQLVMMII